VRWQSPGIGRHSSLTATVFTTGHSVAVQARPYTDDDKATRSPHHHHRVMITSSSSSSSGGAASFSGRPSVIAGPQGHTPQRWRLDTADLEPTAQFVRETVKYVDRLSLRSKHTWRWRTQIDQMQMQKGSVSGGYALWLQTRGSAPGPRWGLCTVIGSRSALTMPPPQKTVALFRRWKNQVNFRVDQLDPTQMARWQLFWHFVNYISDTNDTEPAAYNGAT